MYYVSAFFLNFRVRHYISCNTVATFNSYRDNTQHWWFSIINDVLQIIDEWDTSAYSNTTTLPLQGYSFNYCSGRKNRLLGGFFISIRKSNKGHPVRLVDYQLSNNSVWTRKRITSDALVNACVALRHKHGNVKITLGDWK